ncbi:hypothetical protein [Streptomyces sp. NPDC088752]|uniref:hypothetical protein n=1 Tax=Streptomyces sp. NPDC088752 TaxID=3154963 RepID=UPI003421E22B
MSGHTITFSANELAALILAAGKIAENADLRESCLSPFGEKALDRARCKMHESRGQGAPLVSLRSLQDALSRSEAHLRPEPVEVTGPVEEARAAGYEPKVPYPGFVSSGWLVVCVTCGATRRPSLSDMRAGRRACKHRKGRLPGASATTTSSAPAALDADTDQEQP